MGIIALDFQGRIIAWNPAAERLLGWPREEVLGQPLPNIPPPRAGEFLERLNRVFAGEPLSDMEIVLGRRDSRQLDLRLSAVPGPDATGRISTAILFLVDVSDRTRTERALQETESRYQTLFERNPFPMWAYDVATLRFLAVNDAAVERYGYSRDEFLGMTIKDIRPPGELDKLLADVASVAAGEVDPLSWNAAVWSHRKKDGTVFDVEVLSTTLSFGGWQARLVLAKDVSAERRLQEQLRQAQKMDAVGRLAGGIAHDFNNMLFVISGYAEQIQRRTDEVLKRKALAILKAADRAATLTRQLLMFSRKDLEQSQVFNLNAIVTEMHRMLHRLLGEQIALETVPEPDLWPVKADPGQMEQVLMNLAVNARDAMPNGGRLVIETRNVTIDETYTRMHGGLAPGSYAMLSVSDTGVGMDAETQSHIFEPFFTTKPKDKGTGLGLSIVYGIVQQSGGSVQVYSHPGRGTTFKVYLPRAPQPSAEPAQREEEAPLSPGGTELVLLAEDEEDVRSLAREILEEHGYTVLEALDAPTAVALARERHPQLLLTDMVLPAITGSDLARQVCAVVPGVKVLYMSGYTDRALASQGEDEGGAAFLQKPFTLETLLRKVREVLDRSEEGADG